VTLNGHFALKSVLRLYVWSSEAWLSKLATLKLLANVVGDKTLNRKEQVRHRAILLRQHTEHSFRVSCLFFRHYDTLFGMTLLLDEIILTVHS